MKKNFKIIIQYALVTAFVGIPLVIIVSYSMYNLFHKCPNSGGTSYCPQAYSCGKCKNGYKECKYVDPDGNIGDVSCACNDNIDY